VAGDVWIASLAPIHWTKEIEEFSIETGKLDLWTDAFFTWNAIVLVLEDFSTGTGRVEGGWVRLKKSSPVSARPIRDRMSTAQD
jgi:hypothetical protein